MLNLLFIPTALVYLMVAGLLFFYGLNYFFLSYVTWRQREWHADPPTIDAWPRVTVQLPIYNEMYVAGRLIMAVARLNYPRDLLEIQVLDDSDDETCRLSQNIVNQLKSQGLNIHYIHRRDRRGFKAGALAEGTARATGEFLAIFDADFIPQPVFLERTLPYFKDPRVGFVQARWGHVNWDYSLLTRLQSMALDAYFMVEQFALSQAGLWFNFNGTAGVWRRKALEEAGGWKADTLNEDLDLSYRTYFKGWRAVYLRDVEVPAELPVNFSAYRRQQLRWARGRLECARKYLPQVWKSAIPVSLKIESTLQLTCHAIHLLLCTMTILYPIILIMAPSYSYLISLFGVGLLLNANAFAPLVFFAVAQHQLGQRWWNKLLDILLIYLLGTGMMVNTLRAALQILSRRPGKFERTPKFGIVNKREGWTHRRYQLKVDLILFLEILLAFLNALTVFLAVQSQNWTIAIYAIIFCVGLLFTSGLAISQAISYYFHRFRKMKL